MKKRGKKGQVMGMPFIFIFSLILVAVALFVGFWVIKNFMERAEQLAIYDFTNQLENEVISTWQKEEASKTITLAFSKKFDQICFTNLNSCSQPPGFCYEAKNIWSKTSQDNLFLMPFGTAEKYEASTAWHIKCGQKECLEIQNTICFPVENGKVTIKLTKESGQPVKVSLPLP